MTTSSPSAEDPRVTAARTLTSGPLPRFDVQLPGTELTRMYHEMRRAALGLLDAVDGSAHKAPADTARAGIVLTCEQLREWAGLGRDLTDEELEQLDECIPMSSIPDAIGTIVSDALRLPAVDR